MLFKQATTPFLFETLENLMQWQPLQNFRLVGGTGLSLQLGHRQSVDIDLFSDIEFDKQDLAKIFRKKMPTADIRILTFGLTVYISNVDNNILKLDIMETDAFIRPQVMINGIRLAHLEDIAAMKLEAITSRNIKKDFYDIAELLNIYKLEELLSFYKEKYPYNDIKQVLENITFFSEDCELDFEPKILKEIDWTAVKFSLIDAFNYYIEQQLINHSH